MDHFTLDQFERIALERFGIKKLRRDAVPTIFSYDTIAKQGARSKLLAKGTIRTTKNSCLFKPTWPRPAVTPSEDKSSLTKVHVHQLELDPQAARRPEDLQENGLSCQDSTSIGPEELLEVTTGEEGDLQSGSPASDEYQNLVIVSVCGASEHEMAEDTEPAPRAEFAGGHTYCQSFSIFGQKDQYETGTVETEALAVRSGSRVQHESVDSANELPTRQDVLSVEGGNGLPNGFSSHSGQGLVQTSTAYECLLAGLRGICTQSEIGIASCPLEDFDCAFQAMDHQHETEPEKVLSHGLATHHSQAPGCSGAQDGVQHRHGAEEASVAVASSLAPITFCDGQECVDKPKEASADVILPYPLVCSSVPSEQCKGTVQVEATGNALLNGAIGHVHQGPIHNDTGCGNWQGTAGTGETRVVAANSLASCLQNSVTCTDVGSAHWKEIVPPYIGTGPPGAFVSDPHCGLVLIEGKDTYQQGIAPERTGEEAAAAAISAVGTTFSPVPGLEHVVTVDAGALSPMLERRPLKTEEDLRERIDDLEEKLLRAQRRLAVALARGRRVELENCSLRAQVRRLLQAPAVRYARHRRKRPPSSGGAADESSVMPG
ncbi:uncharacterized protein LOC144104568 isoform X2 [Amblyomma americanum]